jgi:hypothetical protein
MEKMKIIISENHTYISIHISRNKKKSLSWEKLQKIKDSFFENLDFVEVYPTKKEIVNNANVRHLIHIKNWICPKLADLEIDSEIKEV